MARNVSVKSTDRIHSAEIAPVTAEDILKGFFVGLDEDGLMVLADFRAAEGPVPAMGPALQDGMQRDPKGNALEAIRRGSWSTEGIIGGLSGLTPGALYYLYSGGDIIDEPPATSAGDINQIVGRALDATRLLLFLQPEAEI